MRFTLCAWVLLTTLLGAQPNDGNWKTYSTKDGKFSILWPGEPKITQSKHPQTQTVKTNYEAKMPGAGMQLLMVDVADLPAQEVKKNGLEGTVKALSDGMSASGLGTTRVKEEKCVIGKAKLPGKDLVMLLPDKASYVRIRVCLVGDRLYTVTLVGTKLSTEGKLAGRVFDSFTPTE